MKKDTVRRPYVAGMFYAGDPENLKKQIEGCFLHRLGPQTLPRVNVAGERRILGLVSPHAGYMYSGPVAAHGFLDLATDGRPDLFIIIGPNHSGVGSSISVMSTGEWETPLGRVRIDEDIAKEIIKNSEYASEDDLGHTYEHSVEVQIPFLQYIYGSFEFVPITMLLQTLSAARDLGKAISSAVKGLNCVIIASTDFTHYEPHNVAMDKDAQAISAILALDERELFSKVDKFRISMCGYGPVAAMLVAVKNMGAKGAKLLKYATSGDITGDLGRVVGYASIKIFK
ncbi:MAG: AmmeMemoRadiSam system protein B [Candidatus Baldrarchaeia archaeon]